MLVEVKKIGKEEVTVVSSLDVAETFGKEHRNVIRDIEKLVQLEEFGTLNFELSSYKSVQNKELPMYYMTRDGFTLLVMGYTGEKAMKFKIAYINQFNAMEKTIKNGTSILGVKEEVELIGTIAKVLNMNENSKLVCIANALENHGIPTNILPQYTESKDQLLSATELLKRNEIGISVLKFNKIMLDHGYLEEKERNSSKGMKKFKSLTSSEYGENQVSPKNAHVTQPLYYASKFVDLCNKLNIV